MEWAQQGVQSPALTRCSWQIYALTPCEVSEQRFAQLVLNRLSKYRAAAGCRAAHLDIIPAAVLIQREREVGHAAEVEAVQRRAHLPLQKLFLHRAHAAGQRSNAANSMSRRTCRSTRLVYQGPPQNIVTSFTHRYKLLTVSRVQLLSCISRLNAGAGYRAVGERT